MTTAAYIAPRKPEAFLYVSVGPRLASRLLSACPAGAALAPRARPPLLRSLIVSVKPLLFIRLPLVVLCFVIPRIPSLVPLPKVYVLLLLGSDCS